MKLTTYPKHGDEGFSADEIRRGVHWLHTDVECPHCGKVQPVPATRYLGGPCVVCGELSSGAKPETG